MKRSVVLTIAVLACAPASVLAQGSGTSRSDNNTVVGGTERAFGVEGTVQGRVIQSTSNRLVVEDEYGTRHSFSVTGDARLRADQRSLIGHLSNPQLSDFVQGIEVRVTFNDAGFASRVEARRPKTESTSGTILEVDVSNGLLVIETEDGERLAFSAFPSTQLKRDKHSALADKEEDALEVSDYVVGTMVKLEFRVADKGLTKLTAEGL